MLPQLSLMAEHIFCNELPSKIIQTRYKIVKSYANESNYDDYNHTIIMEKSVSEIKKNYYQIKNKKNQF